MSGWCAMPATPHAAMARNQTIITGPKIRPTAAVPLRCTAKSNTMMIAVTGMINTSSDGLRTLSPSTADSTEIAGVIMLSPKNSAAPKMPTAASLVAHRPPPPLPHRRSSVISAMMPPSPWLSTRMAKST
jgi:hypothetical protein